MPDPALGSGGLSIWKLWLQKSIRCKNREKLSFFFLLNKLLALQVVLPGFFSEIIHGLFHTKPIFVIPLFRVPGVPGLSTFLSFCSDAVTFACLIFLARWFYAHEPRILALSACFPQQPVWVHVFWQHRLICSLITLGDHLGVLAALLAWILGVLVLKRLPLRFRHLN